MSYVCRVQDTSQRIPDTSLASSCKAKFSRQAFSMPAKVLPAISACDKVHSLWRQPVLFHRMPTFSKPNKLSHNIYQQAGVCLEPARIEAIDNHHPERLITLTLVTDHHDIDMIFTISSSTCMWCCHGLQVWHRSDLAMLLKLP